MAETSGEWETALAEASSPSWAVRARAGQELAAFADVPVVAEALAGLLLDAHDTAVTRRTAEALARVATVAGVRLIALAVVEADDDQADWLETGVHDVLVDTDGGPEVAAACGSLARDPEEAVRRGAAEIAAWTDGTGD